MTIQELITRSHETALSKGWWEEERSVGECIALMHSELSEALEIARAEDLPLRDIGIEYDEKHYLKPSGFPIELADCIIRIADFCGRHDIDLESALRAKLDYNEHRPYKHGNKKF